MTGRHMIQRQILDITLDRQESFFQMQNRLSQLCHDELGQLLDKMCSAASPDGATYRIDRLEVDLGEISGLDLEQNILSKIQQIFPTVLQDNIGQLEDNQSAVIDAGLNRTKLTLSEIAATVGRHSTETEPLESFIYFIKTGAMPWWHSASAAYPDKIFDELLGKYKKQLLEYLHPVLQHSMARERFVRQMPIHLLRQYIALFAPGAEQQAFLAVIADFNLMAERQTLLAVKTWDYIVWDAVIRITCVDESRLDIAAWLELFISACAQSIAKTDQQTGKEIARMIRQCKSSGHAFHSKLPVLIESLFADLGDTLESKRNENESVDPASNRHELAQLDISDSGLPQRGDLKHDSNKPDDLIGSARHRQPTGNRPTGRSKEITEANREAEGLFHSNNNRHNNPVSTDSPADDLSSKVTPDALYIENAGQVILWPYLKYYFSVLNMINNDGFVAEAERMRAVHLLQYLATGQQKSPECQLLLNKVLCGWPVEKSLDDSITLSMKEELESEQLLLTLVSHWSALKNTSIEGLRMSFMQRNGKLMPTESGWRLSVERQAHDMLLEQLPWTLSIIRLSWMDKPLFVDW
ncbi:MAG: contractile injection system tape measure protein [Mariprofundus sp.]|nr:contractile injection system tape measure protein [Mariprofundus sp.]